MPTTHLAILLLATLPLGSTLADEPALNLQGGVSVPFVGPVVYPDPVGPFVAVAKNDRRAGSKVVISDLRSMKTISELPVEVTAFTYSQLALSGDGYRNVARRRA